MNPVIERVITTLKELPMSRKIALGVFAMVLVAGFTTMFIWTNKTQFRAAYSGLTKEDAAAVVDVLKELNTPYQLTGDGTTIMVPEAVVYEVRLTMAKEGIPKGGGVGYEIFDKSEFGTTEFVLKINKKRAIQGELSRTIQAFDEVKNARVMIVLPKDSVFVEEVKKPSASILLELSSDLDKEKVTAIAHLVASSVQDLTPKLVTIVDTAGRILFEGQSEEEQARIDAENLADTQYQYKVRFEENLTRRIQTMLERIVGKDKAIVRVTSEMDFSKNDMNEEIYDPFERGGDFIRSRKTGLKKSPSKQKIWVSPPV
jgi:flagellar M-ring protein FliF